MVNSVLLAGGGTAGHVNPLLAVADEIRGRDPETRIVILGTDAGLEAELVPARGYELTMIPRVPLPRRPGKAWFAFPARLRSAIAAADRAIREREVDVVIGFGGYVATPAYLAARRRGIPIVVHEQNARPGLANRLGARWAEAVAVTFPGTPLRGGRVTGLPLRREIVELLQRRERDRSGTRRRSAEVLGVDPTRPLLLVTGGSLGAKSINDAMIAVLPEVASRDVQVLHVTGQGKDEEVRTALRGFPELSERYHVAEYLDHMHDAFAVADLVLCRAGAGTVAELTALGIAAAYVPLPIGNGEQRLNVQPVLDAGGGLVVEDSALTPQWIANNVLDLVSDAEALGDYARAARRVGRVHGAQEVVDLAFEQIGDRP